MKFISILIPSVFLSIYCSAQLLLPWRSTLENAYKNNDEGMIFNAIKDHAGKQDDGTKPYSKIDSLLTDFYGYYVKNLSDYNIRNKHLRYFYTTKNIFLKGTVEIGVTDKIDFSLIGKKYPPSGGGVLANIYSFLPDTIYNQRTWAYTIINPDSFVYKPYTVGSSFANLTNEFLTRPGFLTEEGRKEHRRRADFLKKVINLNPINVGDYTNSYYEFIFDYNIDKIILNKTEDKAVIQFSKRTDYYSKMYCEYLFEKKWSKWIFLKRIKNAEL